MLAPSKIMNENSFAMTAAQGPSNFLLNCATSPLSFPKKSNTLYFQELCLNIKIICGLISL